MDRLSDTAIEVINNMHTERLEYNSEYIPLIDAANLLSAYEDTGLTPEEIVKMGMAWEDSKRYAGRLELKLKAYEDLGPVARLRELAQADKDGRLVVFDQGARQTSTPDDDLITLVRPGGDLSVKPCPFCGGNNIVYWQYKHPSGQRWRIACLDCMAMIDPGWVQQHNCLANMWNKRSDAHEEADAALKGCDSDA